VFGVVLEVEKRVLFAVVGIVILKFVVGLQHIERFVVGIVWQMVVDNTETEGMVEHTQAFAIQQVDHFHLLRLYQ
jgi:hypothetical protein